MFRDPSSKKDFFELNDLFRRLTGNTTGIELLQSESKSTIQLPEETIQQAETLLTHVKNLAELFTKLDVPKIQAKLRETDHVIETIKQSSHYPQLTSFVEKTQTIIKKLQDNPQFIFVERKEHMDQTIEEGKKHHFRRLLKDDILPLLKETQEKINAEKKSDVPFIRKNKILDTDTVKKIKTNHAESVKAEMKILDLLSRTIENPKINPIVALEKTLNTLWPTIEALTNAGHSRQIIKIFSELHAALLKYQKEFPDKLINLNNKINEYINQQIDQEFNVFLKTPEGQYIDNQQKLYKNKPIPHLIELQQGLKTTLSQESHHKLKQFDFREFSKHEKLAAMLPKKEFDSFMKKLTSRELLTRQISEPERDQEKKHKQYRKNCL